MTRIVLIAMLALAGCATTSSEAQPSSRENGPAYAGLNQDIRVGGLIVRPLAVTEDSRCPVNVVCVWGGRVVLRARVSAMAGEQVISSLAPLALPGGGTLELASVTPPRLAGRPIAPAAYRFGFRLRR